jgi:hypothetical protein
MRFLVAAMTGVGLLLLAGCAIPERATAPPSDDDAAYVRDVDPFVVRDAAGQPYDHPFLGGLDVPRPQFVDIDADGDPDLFLQEQTGAVKFFENVGTTTEPDFRWRTDQYRDLDIGEWYRFADVDDDGDPDLLAERPFSYIRYYQNVGTPQAPRFTLAADTLKDVTGTPIFSDRQNIPNVTDIDCDDRVDLFLGRLDGTVTRYEATSTDDAVPRFELVSERFEDIEIISRFGQPSMTGSANLHGANTMVFADVDGDGDQDLLWGDFFEPSLLLIENTGSCQTPSLRSEPRLFPPSDPPETSGYNAPALTDIDGDGDEDLFIGVLGGAFNPNRTVQGNFLFYEHTDGGPYELRTRRYLRALDVGTESVPVLADLNADGAVDLLVANKVAPGGSAQSAQVILFHNTGTATQPALAAADTLNLAPSYHYAPALGDLDADDDLDLLLGTWNDGVGLYRNTGTPEAPQFELETAEYVTLTRGSHTTPTLVDIDADGDLDLFVGETSGAINFFRNTGTPEAPQFELVSDEYGGIDVGRRAAPTFLDVDADGDHDMIVGSEQEGLVIFRNTGTPEVPSFERSGTLPVRAPELGTPAFADVDGDGDQDLLMGSRSGGLLYFEQR